ncbi:TetR/AcrR family transcriptional regulator [Nocardiopsis metallicus]|uniref:AcrR family transcriptional regulator n=1 Tax=Nocardiopsis metallicus TaxID=179819 RepID=A0A840WSW5_9ACTN|nr:TetR/AcrR family transcriptional regulator [Nocardiopsis metallicus]MBB5493218.1 AcrR family transcriptional regulator [Nocardiopsis metallicus]
MAERPYHHGDLRSALLTSAERTLAERGPAALSLRELAREAGVSHAAPGRHFKDKQALLDALALSGFQRLRAALEQAGTDHEAAGTDTEGYLLSLARAYMGFALPNAALLDLMYARKHDSDISEQLATAVGDLLAIVLNVIAEGQRAGEIVEGDPGAIAFTVASTLHGFASFSANNTVEDVDESLKDVVHFLMTGLSPR